MSDDKVTKIKKFAKEYIAKILRKMEKSGEKRKGSSVSTATTQAASSASAGTPNSHGDGDVIMSEITFEEAMDLGDSDSDADDPGEDEARGEQDHQDENDSPNPSAIRQPAPSIVHDDLQDEAMAAWAETTNPRSRQQNQDSADGWDRDRDKGDIFREPNGSALSIKS